MSVAEQKRWFIGATGIFVVFMVIAGIWDLQISRHFIDYNSVFGTIFQTFGEFPVYMLLVLSGEIAMAYGFRDRTNGLFSGSLIVGGFALAIWQLRKYLSEIESYSLAVQDNLHRHRPIGLANSDSSEASLNLAVTYVILVFIFIVVTAVLQYWLYNKSDQQVKQLLIVSVFASLTVFLAYEANIALKQAWGRVRPYELNATQSDFTAWYHINGPNGHLSFPSGHSMAATLMIVFAWFTTGKWHRYIWGFGIGYAVLMYISRVRIGAHFMSDTVFSGFLTFLIIYIMWELYRILIAPTNQLQ
ncbi:phosphatase PAP2 family protein [Weissella viridescens]|uniref:Phosphatase PAP2 family protein n=1 Tax=Weissella viridescens TaxID=1629 RepID=A0A3P2RGB5_WEIVI|nr:phosphatase PAP2 family protein [Weissella viridescens]RRG17880.1 phosphatase PAP2 family protein [Weissella viridescens]